MTSAVQICSNALAMLGKSPIASFTEGTDRAQYCANLWPMVRDDMLRKHFWNCAMRRVLLSPLNTPPAFGYSAAFQLPADFLRLYEVGNASQYGNRTPDFALENRTILANATALPLRYVWRNENPDDWDAGLVAAATAGMAAVLAYPITQSAALGEAMAGKAEKALRESKAIDGAENPSETFGNDFPLLAGRY
jgi:hypothetical protein